MTKSEGMTQPKTKNIGAPVSSFILHPSYFS